MDPSRRFSMAFTTMTGFATCIPGSNVESKQGEGFEGYNLNGSPAARGLGAEVSWIRELKP